MSDFFKTDGPINRLADVIIGVFLTGLFTVICSIPIITIGTSLTAGYYTSVKCVRHHEGYVWKEFFKSFKLNLKPSVGMGIGYLLVALVLIIDFCYLYTRTDETGTILYYILFAVAFMYLLCFFFTFFELSRFTMKGFTLLRFAIITAFRHFITSIVNVLIFAAAALCVYLMPWGFCLFPGLALYGCSFLMERVMKKYMPIPEAGSQEADKWYYRD